MKRSIIAIIAVAVFFAFTIPAGAESVFNDMSKCVQSWGKGCSGCGGTQAQAKEAAPSKKCCCMKTDCMGNKVPCGTDNSGKTKLGR